ncbi:MAG TPA: 1-(5-phosphoribosyl)-5-((5-phosphoribosylamino)methylideneamino)imidazole-4-carboxamide isomerase [Gammaproteobacteria bacterium]|nr:1-(5-phosphoribosyl)-5-((5-phosphoribosylamino)methylideneamino)imidazole-4-carboxamide isomerase [Gammaproteobacteria bacterium]
MSNTPKPTNIKLHQKSRILEISFNDDNTYELSTEFLRVYSPSAEVRGHGPGQEVLQFGKEDVNITNVEPVGTYAVCLHFDDNHDTGIYSWEWLHYLGSNQDELWADYIQKLEAAGKRRSPDA